MKKQLVFSSAVTALVLLAGCGGNVTDWAKVTFNQTESYKRDNEIIKKHIKSVQLYDQFATVAKFDALWLSDAVRTMYSTNTCRSLGRDQEGTRSFLRRQLSANEYHIVFTVLSLREVPLTTTLPVWTVSLDIDGKRYLPSELKGAELPAEYCLMFGKLLSNHKHPYDIKFDRKDVDGKDILQGCKVMKLVFSSAQYFGSLVWYLDENGEVTQPPVIKKEKLEPKEHKQRVLGKRNQAIESEVKVKEQVAVLEEESLLEGGDSV